MCMFLNKNKPTSVLSEIVFRKINNQIIIKKNTMN